MTVEVQIDGAAVEVAVSGTGTPGLSAYQLAVLHGYDGTEQQYAAAQNILTGTTTPNAGTGVEGNYYLNTVTGNFYHKSDGVWTLAGNLRGPSGGPVPVGGTTGQMLAKTSATDGAVDWKGIYVGDYGGQPALGVGTYPTVASLCVAGPIISKKITFAGASTNSIILPAAQSTNQFVFATWNGGAGYAFLYISSSAANVFFSSTGGNNDFNTTNSYVQGTGISLFLFSGSIYLQIKSAYSGVMSGSLTFIGV